MAKTQIKLICGKKSFSCNEIIPYIYIGTNACCEKHFDRNLLKMGIKADISLEKAKIDAPYGVDYYLWLPVADGKAPTQSQFMLGVQMLDFCVNHKIKCYVHCKQGHGRAPTLAAAYLISHGLTVKEAINFIAKKRPVTHLNQRQTNSLKRFQKQCQL